MDIEDDNLVSPTPRSYATSPDQAKIFTIVMTGREHMGRRHIEALPSDLTRFVKSQIRSLWSSRLSVPLRCHQGRMWQRALGESFHTLLYYIALVILLKSWTVLKSNRWQGRRGSRNKIRKRKLNWKDLNFILFALLVITVFKSDHKSVLPRHF